MSKEIEGDPVAWLARVLLPDQDPEFVVPLHPNIRKVAHPLRRKTKIATRPKEEEK